MSSEPRTAFVTGASRGIGAGIARALLAQGCRVAVGFREREDLARALCAGHPGGRPVQVDLADTRSIRRALERVAVELGPVEILVNNAAIAQEKPFLEIDEEDWQRMFAVNLFGAAAAVRLALPAMLERGFGRIVNLSSIGGQWGGMNQVHYAASKAALINFTRSIARLYSERGVTSNAVAPGLVATEMSARELASEAGRQKLRAIPSGRLGTAEEIGAAVAFLCSEQAGYVTGQTLNLNGGMYFAA